MKEDNKQEFDDLFNSFFDVNQEPSIDSSNKSKVEDNQTSSTNDSIEELLGSTSFTTPVEKEITKKEEIKTHLSNDMLVSDAPINELESSEIEGGTTPYVINPELMTPRSMEVDEILSYVPNWMIRWGITAIFGILLSLIAISYFIKYPDIVPGQIQITSNIPPATVVSKSRGALELFKEDKAEIKEDEIIALIKNDTKYEDVLELKAALKKFESELDSERSISKFKFPKDLDLGSLQGTFSELVFGLKKLKTQKKSSSLNSYRKDNINQQISQIKNSKKDQLQQIAALKAEYLKIKGVYESRYKPMYKKGSISAEQLEGKESEVTQKLNAYQSAKANLNEYENRILGLESKKDELDYSSSTESTSSLNSISVTYGKLINEINTWENQYLLTAPIDGRLNYLQFVKDNIHIRAEQEVASIIPLLDEDNNQEEVIRGELFITSEGAGKVKKGQMVNVELNAYMKKEFGVLEGHVSEISDIGTTMQDGQNSKVMYKATVDFKDGMTTTVGKEVQFKHNMSGKAEVVTEDLRLIDRIFDQLRDIFDGK